MCLAGCEGGGLEREEVEKGEEWSGSMDKLVKWGERFEEGDWRRG